MDWTDGRGFNFIELITCHCIKFGIAKDTTIFIAKSEKCSETRGRNQVELILPLIHTAYQGIKRMRHSNKEFMHNFFTYFDHFIQRN